MTSRKKISTSDEPKGRLGRPETPSGIAPERGGTSSLSRGRSVCRSREDTRNAILDAANQLLSRSGLRQMSMQGLAKETGISRKTIYMYFGSKEDVALSSIDRLAEQVHSNLSAIAGGVLAPKAKLRELLVERVLGRMREIRRCPWSHDDLIGMAEPEYFEQRGRHRKRELELVEDVIREGNNRGVFHVEDERNVAVALLTATDAFLPRGMGAGTMESQEDVARRVVTMVDILLRGLSASSR